MTSRSFLPAAAILLLAAGLRLYGLERVFPREDEYFQFYTALQTRGWPGFLDSLRANPHHGLVDPLTTFLAARLGAGTWGMRLPSALEGAACSVLLIAAAASLGRARALGAGFLLAVSLSHIDWSRRADFYALLTLASLLHLLALQRLAEGPRRWRAYAGVSALFLYSHPYAMLSGLLHGLWLSTGDPARRRERLRSWALAWGAAAVCYLPLFLFAASSLAGASPFDFVEGPGNPGLLRFLLDVPLHLALGSEEPGFAAWSGSSALAAAACLALFAVSLAGLLRKGGEPLLKLCHLAVPFGLVSVLALDFAYRYYFSHRQLMWVLPFYLLAVADGGARLLEAARPLLRSVAAAFAAAAFLAAFVPSYLALTWSQMRVQDGRDRLAASVAAAVRPGDVFVFDRDILAAGFLYDYDRAAFAAAERLRLDHGRLSFVFGPLEAGASGARAPVKIRDLPEGIRGWFFTGANDDLWVRPPLRPAPSPGR